MNTDPWYLTKVCMHLYKVYTIVASDWISDDDTLSIGKDFMESTAKIQP